MDLDLVEARWRLGVFPPEGLPEVARRLLEEGADGPAIRALAELRSPTRARAGSLFEDLLDGLDRRPMARERAGELVARSLAAKIVSGELPPDEGARRIAWDVWDRCRDLGHLGVFVTLAEKHETGREHRDLIEEGIRREARRLLAG